MALFTVQHPFGSEFLTPAKPALDKAGFKIVYETTYPLGVSDLSAQIKAAKAANPDIMIAFSYPPDTFMLTEQAMANDFNPKFKFLSVGVAFPSYKGKFGDKINGTFGLGAWDPNGPGVKEYVERHKAVNKGRAGPLGLLQHLRRVAGAAAGHRARRRDRPCQDHRGAEDRHVQDHPRRHEARGQPPDQAVVGRPMAGRRVQGHCARQHAGSRGAGLEVTATLQVRRARAIRRGLVFCNYHNATSPFA